MCDVSFLGGLSTEIFFFLPLHVLDNVVVIVAGSRGVLTVEESFRKRPFFSSPEELEEDYYDEQLPEKKRRLTLEQVRYQFVPKLNH